jgi:UDP-glucose 4-epimerase
VHELVRQGHDVTVMNSHEAELPTTVRRLHGDRQEPGAITETLGPHRDDFDAVFDNTAYEIKDLEPMVELFTGRVQHFVFTSSVAVYRRSFVQPILETSRTHDPADADPRKSYGVNKVQCEQYLRWVRSEHDLPVTILRVGHTLGPRSPLVTRDPIFFRRLELGRPVLVPGEGFSAMSLVHVLDVARLMVAILGNPVPVGETYNVVNPDFTTILGAVELIGRAAGVAPAVVHVPMEIARRRNPPLVHWGEALVGSQVFSVDKALRDLDWRPQFTIESGYRDSYEWHAAGGRDQYAYDFSKDDEVLGLLK